MKYMKQNLFNQTYKTKYTKSILGKPNLKEIKVESNPSLSWAWPSSVPACCLSYLTGYPAKLFMLFIWRFLVKHQAFWSWTFFDSPLSGQIKIEQKGLLYYVTFGDETFACCLIPWGHYTTGSKKFQPLVCMWSKPTPSFSNVGALLLKIWTFFWSPFLVLVVWLCCL